MSFKKTLIFFVALLLLGGYYYVFEIKMAEKKEAAETAQKQLFQLKKEDIAAISLKRAAEEIVLKKQENVWKLEQPVAALADANAVDALLTAFIGAEREKTVAEKAEKPEEFGLNAPEIVIAATTQSNAASTLSIGQMTPTSTAYYATAGHAPAVFTISAAFKTEIDKTVYDLRDKTALDFDPAQVKTARFTVTSPEKPTPETIELSQENALWQITSPKTANADTAKVNAILSELKNAAVMEFVAETPDKLADYGLDAPQKILTLTVGDGQEKMLRLGKRSEERGGVYAQHEATGNIFMLPGTVDDEFPNTLNDLRDKTLLTFENDAIQSVEIATATETIAAQRADTAWKLVTPAEFPADAIALNALLNDAKNAKAADFVDDAGTDLAAYGLNPAQLTLTLRAKEADAAHALLIGSAAPNNAGVYAKVGNQDGVVIIPNETAAQFRKTAFDLRDKKIVKFDAEQVKTIEVAYPDNTLVLKQDGDLWKADGQEVQAFKINNLLYDISALEFAQEPLAATPDVTPYGLTTPAATITLRNAKGEEAAVITVGRSPDNSANVYAKTSAADKIYPIAAAFLDELPKDAASLANAE